MEGTCVCERGPEGTRVCGRRDLFLCEKGPVSVGVAQEISAVTQSNEASDKGLYRHPTTTNPGTGEPFLPSYLLGRETCVCGRGPGEERRE